MTKMFCDLCESEIPRGERIWMVALNNRREIGSSTHMTQGGTGEYCYHCVKSGKALERLFAHSQDVA